jgi:flagellar biosynthesis protein FlhA
MPGKQMAIDADLNTGAIDEKEARIRREKISREAEFYGAMDGATKFVKGDAIVALITAVINIVGGIIIGYMTGVPDVLNTYTIATVGDGLVSQIPALLISTATGMVVTRSASESSLSKDVINQFSRLPIAMIITGASMIALVFVTIFIPGFPWLFLLILGGGMLTMGILQTRSQKAALQTAPAVIPAGEEPMISETEFYKNPKNIYTEIDVPPISVEFGYSLISLFDEKEGSNFDDRLTNFKRKFARDMGIVIPEITFIDNIRITPNSYVIKIKDEEVASGEILPGYYLMMDSSGVFENIDGIDTTDPAFGIPAKWIPGSSTERAEILGYSVIDPQSVIITHLSDIIKRYAHEFIGRNEIEMLLDNVRAKNKSLVEDVVGNMVTVAAFQKIITNLLREQIPVKDLVTILETIAEYSAPTANDVDMLTEQCRGALRRTITRIYADEGVLRVIMLDMELDSAILKSVNKTAAGVYFSLDPPVIHGILLSLSENLAKLENIGASQIVMTSPIVRVYFKQLIDQYVPGLTVLSSNEIEPKIQIQALGIIKAESTA